VDDPAIESSEFNTVVCIREKYSQNSSKKSCSFDHRNGTQVWSFD